MRLEAREHVAASADRVVAVLQDVERWPTWLPGLLAVDVHTRLSRGVEATLRFGGPRTISVRLEVQPKDDGVAWQLVEGDVSAVDGRVVVVPTDPGCDVTLAQDLVLPMTLPGTLVAELERELVPRWLRALGSAASGDAGR